MDMNGYETNLVREMACESNTSVRHFNKLKQTCTQLVAIYSAKVPLITCYIGDSENPAVPHRFARSSKNQFARADRHVGTGNGSKLYEVNMWLWKFCR